jgi:hypothetical protein
VLKFLVTIAHPEREALGRTKPGRLTGMILGMSLGRFRSVLLRVYLVRVRQMGAMRGLLVMAGVVMFGRHAVMARGLF